MQNAQSIYLQTIEALLEENEIDKALDALLELDKQTNAGIRQDVILQSGNYKEAEKAFQRGLIGFEEYSRNKAKLRYFLSELMKEVPQKLKLNAQIQGLGAYRFEVPDDVRLEKIIGAKNSLLKINWLEKALRASRAVCRVVCDNGELGTGFVTREGYLFTNQHVLKTADVARTARVEFNYEVDASGAVKSRTTYSLDAATYVASPPEQLDFARVKIVDDPKNPLAQWGFVEFDATALPAVGDAVTIVQHPKGQDKQIALNANDVLGQRAQWVFYTTDTEPGSSGSPVFNQDWKVIALHHAGRANAEINTRGDRAEANEGVLFRDIFKFLESNGKDVPASGGSPAAGRESTQGTGLESVANTPTTNPTPPPNPSPAAPPSGPPKFVVLYDEADALHGKALNKHWAVLKLTKKISVFNLHADVKPGEDLDQRADAELTDARVVVALITPNFFNSDTPFAKLLAAREAGKTVVPVLVEKFDLEGTGLEKLKSLPTQGRTISDFPNADTAWAEVVENLKRAV